MTMISLKAISTLFFFCVYMCIGCKVDLDCDVTNTVCVKNKCICPKGYVMNSDMTACMHVAEGYGFGCDDSVQCSAVLLSGGQCINGTCDCADGYHYLKGRCWKTSNLGDTCSRNESCYVNYDFESSICSQRKCVCTPGYYQREYSSCRRIRDSAGESCLISLDCSYPGGSCLNNRTCGYENQTDKHYEVPPPWPYPIHVDTNKQLGGKCSSNAECGIRYGLCNASKECACAAGYYAVNNSLCYPEIASYCGSDSECIGDYMMCRDGKNWCTCQDGYVPSLDNKYCTKMARDIQWSCLSDRWCSTFGPGGICNNKKCQCSNSTHYVPKKYYCWITKKVGERCKSAEDCGTSAGSEICFNGVCSCNRGYHAATNKTVCRPDGKKIGDFCQENLDCLVKNSMCNTTAEECICQPGYMLLDNTCVPGVGGKCSRKDKCRALGSSCNNSICTCDENHVSSLDYSQCLEIATDLMGNCTESQQCTPLLGEGGTCEGNCTCSEGFHDVDSFCYLNIALYKTCSNSPECQVDNAYSECRNGACQCMYGHPPDAFNRTCSDDSSTIMISQLLLITSSYIMSIMR